MSFAEVYPILTPIALHSVKVPLCAVGFSFKLLADSQFGVALVMGGQRSVSG